MEQLKKMQKEISKIRKEMVKIADKFGIVLPKSDNKRFKIARRFSSDMPETDGLSDEEVLALVKKEVKRFDASKYSDKRILRMRAIMAIKDKYEIKPE